MKMKRIAAFALVLALALSLCACTVRPQKMKTWNFDFSETVTELDVSEVHCDVILKVSPDKGCHVEIYDVDTSRHEAEVKNGTLILEGEAVSHSNFIGLFSLFSSRKACTVTISLPAGSYDSLDLATVSGDVKIPDDFSFTGDVEITTTSGDVDMEPESCSDVEITTVSGDLELEDMICKSLRVMTTSGDLRLENVEAIRMILDTTSGDVALDRTVTDTLEAQTVSGDVTLEKIDTETAEIETVSGDVKGTLRRDMDVTAKTTSGTVRVPDGGSEGTCRVETVSGDIFLQVNKG